jgi:glutaredoxin 3
MISHVELYTKPDCPYCTRAKHLLKTMNIQFNEQMLNRDFTREILLEKFPHAKSYPLVVIDGFHIGGYSQLEEKINEEYKSDKQLLNEGE